MASPITRMLQRNAPESVESPVEVAARRNNNSNYRNPGHRIGNQVLGGVGFNAGFHNQHTGQGGYRDKTIGQFHPIVYYIRDPLEILYHQSALARQMVDLPAREMYRKGIGWQTNDDSSAKKRIEQEEDRLGINEQLEQLTKDGRLYGTAVGIILLKGDTLEGLANEVDPTTVGEGDFANFLLYDRYNMGIETYYSDPLHPEYGQPATYSVHAAHNYKPFTVHASRCIRFDGNRQSQHGYSTYYEPYWGNSVLLPAIDHINRTESVMGGVGQILSKIGLSIIKIKNLRDTFDIPQADQQLSGLRLGARLDDIRAQESAYRVMAIDEEEDYSLLSAMMGGIADAIETVFLMDSMITEIPGSRLFGRSPAGLNATGESEEIVWQERIESLQKVQRPQRRKLNEFLVRSAGVDEVPLFEYMPLRPLTEKEIADTAKTKAEALAILLNQGVMTPDEARASLHRDKIFGDMEGPAPMGLSMVAPMDAPPEYEIPEDKTVDSAKE